jgi:hypothetical protein
LQCVCSQVFTCGYRFAVDEYGAPVRSPVLVLVRVPVRGRILNRIYSPPRATRPRRPTSPRMPTRRVIRPVDIAGAAAAHSAKQAGSEQSVSPLPSLSIWSPQISTGATTGVFVRVGVTVGVEVSVGVLLGVCDGVTVGVGVFVGVFVGVTVDVGVGVGDSLGPMVGVLVGV